MSILNRLITLVLALTLPSISLARGGLTHKKDKIFNDLIIQGERPEISGCVAKAVLMAKNSRESSRLELDEGITEKAILNESRSADHILRTISFDVTAQVKSTLFITKREKFFITCTQYDESEMDVQIKKY